MAFLPDLQERLGRTAKRLQRGLADIGKRRIFDDAALQGLEDVLIQADLGEALAVRLSANLARTRLGKPFDEAGIKAALASEITGLLEPVARPLPISGEKPQVILVVGVNGSGKTTSIGKIAHQLSRAGKRVHLAACDTFRAAAVEQLAIWGKRADATVHLAPSGADPASLAFDAARKARAAGADLLFVDTAGRLQNRRDLMDELVKIRRALARIDETAPHDVLLILDATTGQNLLRQVEIFHAQTGVTGLMMTKLDGTARGGILVTLAWKTGLPVHAIGVGEQIGDLRPLEPSQFARALLG